MVSLIRSSSRLNRSFSIRTFRSLISSFGNMLSGKSDTKKELIAIPSFKSSNILSQKTTSANISDLDFSGHTLINEPGKVDYAYFCEFLRQDDTKYISGLIELRQSIDGLLFFLCPLEATKYETRFLTKQDTAFNKKGEKVLFFMSKVDRNCLVVFSLLREFGISLEEYENGFQVTIFNGNDVTKYTEIHDKILFLTESLTKEVDDLLFDLLNFHNTSKFYDTKMLNKFKYSSVFMPRLAIVTTKMADIVELYDLPGMPINVKILNQRMSRLLRKSSSLDFAANSYPIGEIAKFYRNLNLNISKDLNYNDDLNCEMSKVKKFLFFCTSSVGIRMHYIYNRLSPKFFDEKMHRLCKIIDLRKIFLTNFDNFLSNQFIKNASLNSMKNNLEIFLKTNCLFNNMFFGELFLLFLVRIFPFFGYLSKIFKDYNDDIVYHDSTVIEKLSAKFSELTVEQKRSKEVSVIILNCLCSFMGEFSTIALANGLKQSIDGSNLLLQNNLVILQSLMLQTENIIKKSQYPSPSIAEIYLTQFKLLKTLYMIHFAIFEASNNFKSKKRSVSPFELETKEVSRIWNFLTEDNNKNKQSLIECAFGIVVNGYMDSKNDQEMMVMIDEMIKEIYMPHKSPIEQLLGQLL